MSIAIAVIIFGIIVLIHEWGHYISARKCGILVEEFAIGMGPKVWSTKKGDTVYSLRLLPLGGFCAMLGENDGNEDPRAFSSKSIGQRFVVLFAGVAMNFLLAFLLFTGLTFFSAVSEPVIDRVLEDSPAMAAGLQKGDRIVKVDKASVHIYENLMFALSQSDGSAMNVTILRDGEKIQKIIAPKPDENGDYKIGFGMNVKTGFLMPREEGYERAGFFESVSNGFFKISYCIEVTLYGLNQIIARNFTLNEISGPIGIVDFIGDTYTESITYGVGAAAKTMLSFMALLSANLGVMNLLPLPALDGGRLLFLAVEFVRRKPLPPEKEGVVHFVGFVLLMGLGLIVAYNDVLKLLAK